MNITENIKTITKQLPPTVQLVAVSKFHPVEAIQEAYDGGQRIFGESKMQELKQKYDSLPPDIEWHFIGHLQTNKVKSIIPFTHTIHSVDSWKLLSEIEKHAATAQKQIKCLLEIRIGEENSKSGLSFDECINLLSKEPWNDNKYAYIGGVMGMATNTENESQIRNEFRNLRSFFDELKKNYFSNNKHFSEISMGMSHDYTIALEEGSTMVRIGSSIFGDREY